VIGDIAELQAQASADNTGPDTNSQGSSPVSFLFHSCVNNSSCLHSWQVLFVRDVYS